MSAIETWYDRPPKNTRKKGIHVNWVRKASQKPAWPERKRKMASATGELAVKTIQSARMMFHDEL